MGPTALCLPGTRAPPGCGLVAQGKPTSVQAMSASKAFWTLPDVFLKALSDEKGWDLKGNLMEMVKRAVTRILGPKEEDDLYEILLQRSFPKNVWDGSWMDNQDILGELDSSAFKDVQEQGSVDLGALQKG